MSLEITIVLRPGGNGRGSKEVGSIRIWREHVEARQVNSYGFRATTRSGTRSGSGVPHRYGDDVLMLLRAVLNHSEGTPGYCRTCHRQGPTLPGTAHETLFEPTEPLSDPTANGVAIARGAQETSVKAANMAFPRSGTNRGRILAFLARHGPGTDQVIQAVLGMTAQAETPRRGELVKGGWVEDSGRREKTITGADAIVWQVTERGKAELARRAETAPVSDPSDVCAADPPEQLEPEPPCWVCGGHGYAVELQHAHRCPALDGGPCNSTDCPWPVQAPCPNCR